MDLQRLTEKSQEALRSAQGLASRRGHQGVGVEHLLAALLEDEGGLAGRVLQKAGTDEKNLRESVERALEKLPQVSGSGHNPEQVYLTQRLARFLDKAETEAKMNRKVNEYSLNNALFDLISIFWRANATPRPLAAPAALAHGTYHLTL